MNSFAKVRNSLLYIKNKKGEKTKYYVKELYFDKY